MSSTTAPNPANDVAARRPYRKPRLVAHGRLVDLTRTTGNNGPLYDNPGKANPMKTGL